MKKLFLLLTLSLFTLSFVNAQEEKKEEIVYSENIQDSFFRVKFGASREEVIKAFEKEGLILNRQYSTKSEVSFVPYGDYFSFGGMDWNFVNVLFSNDKFYGIYFGYTPENKKTALDYFETVLSALSSKYKMNAKSIEDENIYKTYVATDRDKKFVAVQCAKDESHDGEMRYYVGLIYGDDTLDKPSDEL